MDAQKGKIYTKLSKMIIVAVKEGGPDPENNFRLKDMIDKAKAANMPNDNIERAIKRGSGELGGTNIEEIIYEGYGPGGVAIMVEATTDNRNRTAGELRHIFDRHGGNLGETGCVAWMFDRKGVLIIEKSNDIAIDDVMMIAIDAGADDVEEENEYIEILTSVNNFKGVKSAMEQNSIPLVSAEISFVPQNTLTVPKKEQENVEKLINALDEHDDIQNVYSNYDFPEE